MQRLVPLAKKKEEADADSVQKILQDDAAQPAGHHARGHLQTAPKTSKALGFSTRNLKSMAPGRGLEHDGVLVCALRSLGVCPAEWCASWCVPCVLGCVPCGVLVCALRFASRTEVGC